MYYKCEICWNIVQLVENGGGQLVCCWQPMKQIVDNTVEASIEKHIPVVSFDKNTINIQVWEILHPMEEKHYIMWIEIWTDKLFIRKKLKPFDEPKMSVCLCENIEELTVKAYCNLHWMWKKNLKDKKL